MTALLIAVVVCIASFIPAPDLDAPKVYYKACIYCQDCTPKQVVWDIIFTAYVPQGDCYRCQRTGKRMVFDSVGVVQWGKIEQGVNCLIADGAVYCDSTILIADTSGIMRIQ